MMKPVRMGVVVSGLLLGGAILWAQGSPAWEKSYAVSGQPVLALEVSDSGVTVRSCGECRAVHVKVEMRNVKLSDYVLEESQSGNTIHFSLKERTHIGFHIGMRSQSVQVLVETPANVTLQGRSTDGSMSVRGLHGEINLASSDGSLDVEDVSGNLKLRTSDGSLRVGGGRGRLEARSSDGSQDIAGLFESWQVASSDGSLKLELLEGTKLSGPSTVESRDGSLTMEVPRQLAAEFDVRTRDGGLKSDLPLTTSGYDSREEQGHAVHGKMNGGGPLVTVRNSDGSVRVGAS
jgi:Putative adhesin